MGGENRQGPVSREGEWQGKPTLELAWRDDFRYPFNFGVGKAKLIMAAVERGLIQAFIEKHKDDPKTERTYTPPRGDEAPAPTNEEWDRYNRGNADGSRQGSGYRQPGGYRE